MLWIQSENGPGLNWIWGIAAFGLSAIIYNVAFFILCSVFTPSLSTRVEDDTEVQGDDVVHVVRHITSGDEQLDSYIKVYATARAVTAVSIVSVIAGGIAIAFF